MLEYQTRKTCKIRKNKVIFKQENRGYKSHNLKESAMNFYELNEDIEEQSGNARELLAGISSLPVKNEEVREKIIHLLVDLLSSLKDNNGDVNLAHVALAEAYDRKGYINFDGVTEERNKAYNDGSGAFALQVNFVIDRDYSDLGPAKNMDEIAEEFRAEAKSMALAKREAELFVRKLELENEMRALEAEEKRLMEAQD